MLLDKPEFEDIREALREHLYSEVSNYVDGFDDETLIDSVWDQDKGEIYQLEANRLFAEFLKEWRTKHA